MRSSIIIYPIAWTITEHVQLPHPGEKAENSRRVESKASANITGARAGTRWVSSAVAARHGACHCISITIQCPRACSRSLEAATEAQSPLI